MNSILFDKRGSRRRRRHPAATATLLILLLLLILPPCVSAAGVPNYYHHSFGVMSINDTDGNSTAVLSGRYVDSFHARLVRTAAAVAASGAAMAFLGAADAVVMMQLYTTLHESPCGSVYALFEDANHDSIARVNGPLRFNSIGRLGPVLGLVLVQVAAITCLFGVVLLIATFFTSGLGVPNGVLIGKELARVPRLVPTILTLTFPGICYESCMLLYGNEDPELSERVIGAVGLFLCLLVIMFFHARSWFIRAHPGGITSLAYRYPKPLVDRRLSSTPFRRAIRSWIVCRYWWGRDALRSDKVIFAQLRPQAAYLGVAQQFHKVIFATMVLCVNPASFTSDHRQQKLGCTVLFSMTSFALIASACFVVALRPYRLPISNITEFAQLILLAAVLIARAASDEAAASVCEIIFFCAALLHIVMVAVGFVVDNASMYHVLRHPQRLLSWPEALALPRTQDGCCGLIPTHPGGGGGVSRAVRDVGARRGRGRVTCRDGILIRSDSDTNNNNTKGSKGGERGDVTRSSLETTARFSWSGMRSASGKPKAPQSISWVDTVEPSPHRSQPSREGDGEDRPARETSDSPSSSTERGSTPSRDRRRRPRGRETVSSTPDQDEDDLPPPPTHHRQETDDSGQSSEGFSDPFLYHCSSTKNVVEVSYHGIWKSLVRVVTCTRDTLDQDKVDIVKLRRYRRCKRFRRHLLSQGLVVPNANEEAEFDTSTQRELRNKMNQAQDRKIRRKSAFEQYKCRITSPVTPVPSSSAGQYPIARRPFGDSHHLGDDEERELYLQERRDRIRLAHERAKQQQSNQQRTIMMNSVVPGGSSFAAEGGASHNSHNAVSFVNNDHDDTPTHGASSIASVDTGGVAAASGSSFQGFQYGRGDIYGSPERRRTTAPRSHRLLQGTAPTLVDVPSNEGSGRLLGDPVVLSSQLALQPAADDGFNAIDPVPTDLPSDDKLPPSFSNSFSIRSGTLLAPPPKPHQREGSSGTNKGILAPSPMHSGSLSGRFPTNSITTPSGDDDATPSSKKDSNSPTGEEGTPAASSRSLTHSLSPPSSPNSNAPTPTSSRRRTRVGGSERSQAPLKVTTRQEQHHNNGAHSTTRGVITRRSIYDDDNSSSRSSSLTDDLGDASEGYSFNQLLSDSYKQYNDSELFWSSDTWPTSDLPSGGGSDEVGGDGDLMDTVSDTTSSNNSDDGRSQIGGGIMGRSCPIDVRTYLVSDVVVPPTTTTTNGGITSLTDTDYHQFEYDTHMHAPPSD